MENTLISCLQELAMGALVIPGEKISISFDTPKEKPFKTQVVASTTGKDQVVIASINNQDANMAIDLAYQKAFEACREMEQFSVGLLNITIDINGDDLKEACKKHREIQQKRLG